MEDPDGKCLDELAQGTILPETRGGLSERHQIEQILRTFGILVIMFASVFLVIAGYSATQITPVIGLLGTIAGYLLGRRIEPTTPEADGRRQREE